MTSKDSTTLRTSKDGINLIKKFEGCKLKAYLCPAKVWTIGYGSTEGVTEGMTISQEVAEYMLATDLIRFEKGVAALVTTKLNQPQFDALVCFSYNVGLGALKKSTLLKRINAGEMLPAAEEFLKWDKAGGKVLPGLTARRKAERELFLRGYKV